MSETEIEKKANAGVTESFVRIIALLGFVVFFALDKMGHYIDPLPEYWYGTAAAVFILGDKVARFIDKLK